MFDLDLSTEFAIEQGLKAERKDENLLVVDLGYDLRLRFENWPHQNDTIIYFEDSDKGWHSHGDLFVGKNGDVSLVPLDVIQELQDGSLLVSIIEYPGGESDISLEYAWRSFDLGTIEEGEKHSFIRILNKGSIEADKMENH